MTREELFHQAFTGNQQRIFRICSHFFHDAEGRNEAYQEALNASDRTLVSLYLEELSTHEMSEVTGISEANVRVRIHRIKEKIKQKWEEEYHGTR